MEIDTAETGLIYYGNLFWIHNEVNIGLKPDKHEVVMGHPSLIPPRLTTHETRIVKILFSACQRS